MKEEERNKCRRDGWRLNTKLIDLHLLLISLMSCSSGNYIGPRIILLHLLSAFFTPVYYLARLENKRIYTYLYIQSIKTSHNNATPTAGHGIYSKPIPDWLRSPASSCLTRSFSISACLDVSSTHRRAIRPLVAPRSSSPSSDLFPGTSGVDLDSSSVKLVRNFLSICISWLVLEFHPLGSTIFRAS